MVYDATAASGRLTDLEASGPDVTEMSCEWILQPAIYEVKAQGLFWRIVWLK